jgi:multiple sugar transport system permease protein
MPSRVKSTPPKSSSASLRKSTRRFTIYALLGGASCLFLIPFVWLVITSLKPIEQSMTMPPSWIPRAYYADVGAGRIEVTRDYRTTQAGAVAAVADGEGGTKAVFYSAAQLADLARGGVAVRLLYRVEEGWWRVTEKLPASADAGTVPHWRFVPPAGVESRVVFRWENYPNALHRLDGGSDDPASLASKHRVSFTRFAGNSLIICILGVIGTVFSNAIVAYGFARVRWKGRDAFFAVTLATMMVPFPVLMVPLYSVFKELHMIGTLMPLWVPAWFGSAFNIFLMRQFFRTIPEELSEAARIDGCGEWTIFWRIILPLSKPVLVTAGVLHFLYAWNDFMGPLLYLTRKETFPLSLALQSFQAQTGGVQWHHLMAASTVTIIPVIVLFFFAQKTFVQGIATTGSKS